MKNFLFIIFLGFSCLVNAETPQNVILFIGDGMSVPQRMLADEFARKVGHGPLAMNNLAYVATTRTCSSNSLVTDSAAAATAIACGVKTNNGSIGVDAKGQSQRSCAEVARDAGKKVGIITTVTLTHATPAGFYGHRSSRGQTYGLALDLANSQMDFFAGGGLDYSYNDRKAAGYVGDAYAYAASKGYTVISNRADFAAITSHTGKILTRFTDGPLSYAIDSEAQNQPSLAEMTRKALEVLPSPKGFFLMVEGGRIDWAGHANDAATNLREVLAFDEAVRVALAFQKTHPETLIVVTGDHETGGMSMGFAGTGYALYPERLKNQTMSVGAFDQMVQRVLSENPEADFDAIAPVITQAFGLIAQNRPKNNPLSVTNEEKKELKDAFKHDCDLHHRHVKENKKYDGEKQYKLGGVCRLILSHKSGIGWSSSAHTAMPVLTTAQGVGAERFTGLIENTQISAVLKDFFTAD